MNWFTICLATLCLTACDGGFDCPIDTPPCCENVLFGCGTFDLPSGCDCSQYGWFSQLNRQLLSKQAASKTSARRPIRKRSLSGTWSGTLEQVSGNCLLFPASVHGVVEVRERNGTVTVSYPGYGKLSGRARNGNFSVSGEYSPLAFCSAQVNGTFVRVKQQSGKVSVRINYSCGNSLVCRSKYAGYVALSQ